MNFDCESMQREREREAGARRRELGEGSRVTQRVILPGNWICVEGK